MFLHKKRLPFKQLVILLYKYWAFIGILLLLCISILSYFYNQKGGGVQEINISTGIKDIGITKPVISNNDHLCLRIEGDSMKGILDNGEYVWVKRLENSKREIQRDDIIVTHQSGYQTDIIKKVRGIPGDILSVHDMYTEGKEYYSGGIMKGSFFIKINNLPITTQNGDLLIYPPNKKAMFSLYVGKIPENSFLILGNQQGGTFDSSRFGLISGDEFLGIVQDHGKKEEFCKNKKLGVEIKE